METATGAASMKEDSVNTRRTFIKVGALMGTAGVLGALVPSGSTSLKPSFGAEPSTSLDETLTLMLARREIEPYNGISSFYVPSNASVSMKKTVPAGLTFLVREDKINVGQDHALQLTAWVDGEQVLVDPDVVQSRYERSFRLVGSTSIYAVRSELSMKVVNLTSKTKYFSLMQSGAKMQTAQWDSLLSKVKG